MNELKFPKKPIRLENETDSQFNKRIETYQDLKRKYKKDYAKIKYDENPNKVLAKNKSWRAANPEKERSIRKRYSLKTVEAKKIYDIEYRKVNFEKLKNRKKIYRVTNEDKLKIKRKKYLSKLKDSSDFSEKRSAYYRQYYSLKKLQDQQYIARRSLRNSLKNNIQRYMAGKKTNSIKDLIGCTIEEFIKYVELQFVEGMTWTPKNFHLDHIKPCKSFDLTDSEQIKQCFHYTNYQPLWPLENLQKNAKLNWKR